MRLIRPDEVAGGDVRGRESSEAFTLTELMVSTAVASMVLAGVTMTMLLLGRMELLIQTRADIQSRNRFASAVFSREVREAVTISVGGDHSLTLVSEDGVQTAYDWDSTGGTWIRSSAGLTTKLLSGCTNLSVAFYARPATNSNDPFGTLTTCDASVSGVVEANWICVRTNSSVIGNISESYRTGRIERRNH